MHRAYFLPGFIALLIGCGSTGGATAAGGAGTTSTEGPIPCESTSCSLEEYCFHPVYCDNHTDAGSCPSTCGTLPATCPFGQCTCPTSDNGFGGYFGAPDAGADSGTPYPDHQVACYGS
jgi:hypothetical protein